MRLRLLCFSAAALLLAGCSTASSDDAPPETQTTAAEEASFPRTLEIPGGQREPAATVTLEAEPTRVAALTYETGELVASLGATDRLVLVQESLANPVISSHAQEMADVENHAPTEGSVDAEAVIAADPDLVLLSTRRGLEEGVAKVLEGAGIPVLTLPNHWANLDDITSNIAIVGEALGLEDAADDLTTSLTEGLVEEDIPEADRPKVLALSNQAGQPFVIAEETFPLEVLRLAGAEDAGADLGFERSGPISAEQVIAAEPDAILLVDMNGSGDRIFAPLLENDAVAALPAVSQERVLLMEGRKLQALGFTATIEGREELATWLGEEVTPAG